MVFPSSVPGRPKGAGGGSDRWRGKAVAGSRLDENAVAEEGSETAVRVALRTRQSGRSWATARGAAESARTAVMRSSSDIEEGLVRAVRSVTAKASASPSTERVVVSQHVISRSESQNDPSGARVDNLGLLRATNDCEKQESQNGRSSSSGRRSMVGDGAD